MIFCEISLQHHVPHVDRVLQDVAHKVYGAGVAVLFQPFRCLPHGDVIQEILENPPNGYGFLLVDDEGLAVPTVAVSRRVPLLPALEFFLYRPFRIVRYASALILRICRQNTEHKFPVCRHRADVFFFKPDIDAK